MSKERRTNTNRVALRLTILLIATVIVKYALAAPGLWISASEIEKNTNAESRGDIAVIAESPSSFVPREKISADKSISFPTDI